MDFSAFDTTRQAQYAKEAKAKWGSTDAYREFTQKTEGQSPSQQQAAGDALMDIFAQFGAIRHLDPTCEAAHALVSKLQAFISEHYYTCTKQILSGLGQLYIAGDSMTENIDRSGGPGTAQFVSQAIHHYCK